MQNMLMNPHIWEIIHWMILMRFIKKSRKAFRIYIISFTISLVWAFIQPDLQIKPITVRRYLIRLNHILLKLVQKFMKILNTWESIIFIILIHFQIKWKPDIPFHYIHMPYRLFLTVHTETTMISGQWSMNLVMQMSIIPIRPVLFTIIHSAIHSIPSKFILREWKLCLLNITMIFSAKSRVKRLQTSQFIQWHHQL